MDDQSASADTTAYTVPAIVSRQRVEGLLEAIDDSIVSDGQPTN